MMIFKKAIARRTFLRGVGATVALPLLDGMVPAFAGALDTAAKSPVRLGFVYVPNGIVMQKWTPAAEGASFELTPTLEPLAPFRDRLLVVSGLSHDAARLRPGEAGGQHALASGAYLTSVHPKKTEGADIHAGISVDQMAAKELGQHTQLASLELALDYERAGEAESGYSAVYTNTLSWRGPTTPMPMESKPRAVFERLFGNSDSTDSKERLARVQKNRSLLDFVTQDVNRHMSALGPGDRTKLTEYLEAIRDVERRIQVAEEQASREMPTMERPAGVPETFEEHAKLMFDLQALAYQSDLTRVVTFLMAREQSNRTYREIGIAEAHHPLSHHAGDAAKIAQLTQINLFHIKTFAYFLEKLRTTPDGDGSLLDHVIISYGGGLSDGNNHSTDDVPLLLLGGGLGQLKGGRHLRYPKEKQVGNLFLTVLDMLGMPVEHLGDSAGKLEPLSV